MVESSTLRDESLPGELNNTTSTLKNSHYTQVLDSSVGLKLIWTRSCLGPGDAINEHVLQCITKTPSFDWLLYIVPSIAFVLGLFLFTHICKTQQRKEKEIRRAVAIKANTNPARYANPRTEHTRAVKNLSEKHNSIKSQENLCKTQSYENVTEVIYSNEEKVTYCVLQDGDYITPDGDATEQDQNYLQPLSLTDTDGESYENMEGSVYAQPRRAKHALSTNDDDYINPDVEQKHNLEQTDTESYENMAGTAYNNPTEQTGTDSADGGCYERMDRGWKQGEVTGSPWSSRQGTV